MNVLEKILEEIEDHAIEFESFGMCDDYVKCWLGKRHYPFSYGRCSEVQRMQPKKIYMQGYEDGKKMTVGFR